MTHLEMMRTMLDHLQGESENPGFKYTEEDSPDGMDVDFTVEDGGYSGFFTILRFDGETGKIKEILAYE